MPIKRTDFEKGNFEKRRNNGEEEHPVAILLRKNTNLAYTVKEIAEKVKLHEKTVRSFLRSLKKKKLVVHKSPYFAWKK